MSSRAAPQLRPRVGSRPSRRAQRAWRVHALCATQCEVLGRRAMSMCLQLQKAFFEHGITCVKTAVARYMTQLSAECARRRVAMALAARGAER
eukprot:scaffold49462_cov60-Phaeocystis_antarctica.AAC.3